MCASLLAMESPNNGPISESIRPNPVEASGGRCGMAEAERVESGRWQVANKGTEVGTLTGCDAKRKVSLPGRSNQDCRR
jgi:hypothetical protein